MVKRAKQFIDSVVGQYDQRQALAELEQILSLKPGLFAGELCVHVLSNLSTLGVVHKTANINMNVSCLKLYQLAQLPGRDDACAIGIQTNCADMASTYTFNHQAAFGEYDMFAIGDMARQVYEGAYQHQRFNNGE